MRNQRLHGCWQTGWLCLLVFLFLVVPAHAKIYADKKTKLYHREFCVEVKQIKERNLRVFDSEPEASAHGFFPCDKCVTPAGPPSMKDKELKKLSGPIERQKTYLADIGKKIYHQAWCPRIADIPDQDRRSFTSATAALDAGFEPCKECSPPARFKRSTMVTSPGAEIKPMQKKDVDALQSMPGEDAQQQEAPAGKSGKSGK